MRLVVAEGAMADLTRLHAFLAENNSVAAERAVSILVDALQSLVVFPERGRPSGTPDVRELVAPFGRSSYVVRYACLLDKQEIVVLRIWHGREARE